MSRSSTARQSAESGRTILAVSQALDMARLQDFFTTGPTAPNLARLAATIQAQQAQGNPEGTHHHTLAEALVVHILYAEGHRDLPPRADIEAVIERMYIAMEATTKGAYNQFVLCAMAGHPPPESRAECMARVAWETAAIAALTPENVARTWATMAAHNLGLFRETARN